MLPVGIVGGGDRLEIIRGDAYFQSYICRIPRSTIELALSHRLDVLDGMLFPAICDVIRNLSGMWSMLFPDRYVRYVDVPQNFDPAVGGTFWRFEMERLRADFARLSGRTVSDEDLSRSIEVYNENRRAIRDLYAARSRRPWVFPLAEVYLFLRAGNVLPPEEHTAMLRSSISSSLSRTANVETRTGAGSSSSGCSASNPRRGFSSRSKGPDAGSSTTICSSASAGFRSEVPTTGDPMENLVDAYLNHSASTASRYAPEGDRARWLIDSVRRHDAEGVIFCAPSFCDPALLEQPILVAALDREGIPHTEFKYSEDTGQFAVIREQAGTFSDSIRLWSEA